MTLPQLQNFLKVAETLNFRQASEQILIAQPALSRQIQQLEAEIGFQLFNRDRRRVELTESGKFFRLSVERLISQLDDAIRRGGEIERGEAGEIRIGHASSTMQSILPQLLKRLRHKYPQLKVVLFETTNKQQIERLRHREIDFGFVPNIFIPDDLSGYTLYEEFFHLIFSRNHWLSKNRSFNFRDLKHEDFILPPRKEGIGYVEFIERICQDYGFSPHTLHESPNAASVLRLVEADLGISIMGASALKGVKLNIDSMPLTDNNLKLRMSLIWLSERTEELSNILNLLKETVLETTDSSAD
jgi:LysR family transcriptional regulator, benzoate and cis,cis-muconate-responsive activator of ben and cat genes